MVAAAAAAAHLLPMHPSASAVHNEARNVVAVAAAAAVAVASAGMARSGGVGVDIGCDRCWSVSSSVLKMGGGKEKKRMTMSIDTAGYDVMLVNLLFHH